MLSPAPSRRLLAAKATLDKDKALFAYSHITAPFDGVVTRLYEYTAPCCRRELLRILATQALCRLSQNNLLRLVIPVPERAVPDLRLGEMIDVKVSATGKTFSGKIVRFSDQIDMQTRTMHTEVQVPNPNYELVPGMYASAEIPLQRADNVLTVPMQAVQAAGADKGTALVVNSANQIERRDVTLGLQTATQAEIVSGLKEDDRVIFGSQSQYQPGELVTPKASRLKKWSSNHMPSFAIRHPYLIIVFCLVVVVLGVTSVARMPVDMFPPINIPVVLVATFYSGMPPQQIEADITDTFERFFTLASGVDHMESRSLTGVSLIKIYFQPGTRRQCGRHPDFQSGHGGPAALPRRHAAPGRAEGGCFEPAGVSADRGGARLERDAASRLPAISDSQSDRRRPGRHGSAAIWRQVPPAHGLRGPAEIAGSRIESHGCGARDQLLQSDLAGRRRAHRPDGLQHLHQRAGSQRAGLNDVPLKTEGQKSVFVSDVGKAVDGSALQYNIVRVDGQKSVYVAVQKQGGDTNTIAVVDGIRNAIKNLRDIPSQLKASVVFDQSVFVKEAISTVLREGGIGIFLTGIMILMFLGQLSRHGRRVPVHSDLGDDHIFHAALRWANPSTPWC